MIIIILGINLFYSATETFIDNLMINDTFFEVSMFNYNNLIVNAMMFSNSIGYYLSYK